MKTENYAQGQTQRPIDVAMQRGASLNETLRAAQLVFTAVRSPMTVEQRVELLERLVLLQSEVILATLGVLTDHDGQIDATKDTVDQWMREPLNDTVLDGGNQASPQVYDELAFQAGKFVPDQEIA